MTLQLPQWAWGWVMITCYPQTLKAKCQRLTLWSGHHIYIYWNQEAIFETTMQTPHYLHPHVHIQPYWCTSEKPTVKPNSHCQHFMCLKSQSPAVLTQPQQSLHCYHSYWKKTEMWVDLLEHGWQCSHPPRNTGLHPGAFLKNRNFWRLCVKFHSREYA